ncbi:MAG: IPT/TIG domain-containing protein [Alkaliphilus sp.]
MKRKVAISMVTILIMSMFSPFINIINVKEAYSSITPTIDRITIQEEVKVVNDERVTTYKIIFNGFPLTNIEAIRVRKREGTYPDYTYPVQKTLTGFTQIDDANIIHVPTGAGQTLQTIFNATGDVYFSIIRDGEEHFDAVHQNKAFLIPDIDIMKVDTINSLSPASWPIDILKGEKFTLEGSHFDPLNFELAVTTGDFVANPVTYTINPEATTATVGTDTVNIAAGINQNLIFQRHSGNFVTVRYIVRNAINVANPLNLGTVDITPLQGTQGTIVRVKAEHQVPLLDIGTKIFIGGQEAVRNVGAFTDGTFTYQEGGNQKVGLEVIVPFISTIGEKPITIQNFDGDTYFHPQNFNYVIATGAVLEIIDVNPTEAFTNKEKLIEQLRVRNLVAVNSLANVTLDGATIETGTEVNLEFLTVLDSKAYDPKAHYIRYVLADGSFIERKINVFIALKTDIESVPLEWDEQDITSIQVMTDKVGLAGKYTITVRTETVHFEDNAGNINELQFVVEEAPLGGHTKVEFEFKPDITTPTIDTITPDFGPYNQDIVATIEGENFIVVSAGIERHFPTVIIGSDAVSGDHKYKIITRNSEGQTLVYFTDRADGANLPARTNVSADPWISGRWKVVEAEFLVLNEANKVVDGQAITTGNKIKFTIPAAVSGMYSGFANVTVFNPGPAGALGGRAIGKNLFEYVNPAPDALLPNIESITPDKASVGSNEEVIIEGINFQPEALVTVDGEVIQNPAIDVVRGTITFNLPDGRPGHTYIQVINRDGGFASHPFEFVQTFSQPVIQQIIPNIGGKGSLVIIKGNGFFPANPLGETEEIRKGTRVLIDGKDINFEYFRDGTNELELREFTSPFDEDPRPRIIGPDGNPIMTFGSNVAVIDHETIYMIIPDPRDPNKGFFMNEWLNVEVVNPDLGRDMLKNGFKIIDVVARPEIDEISPNLGDFRGGNIAEITGDNFFENARVFFGTEEAEVFRRSGNARTIWVYVPPYGRDLEDQNEAIVPVTIQNADGSSFSRFDGYTYVNPGYTPEITELIPNTGNTAGGERVIISGINFRAHNFGETEEERLAGLPNVYFAGIRVPKEHITFVLPPKDVYEEVEVSDMIIVEITPANPAGKVDVTVINHDGATANLKDGFEYISKQPTITHVLPPQGALTGNSEITIVGDDFIERGLHVAFGDKNAYNDVLSGQARVEVGDVIVNYNAFLDDNISLFLNEAIPGNELEVYMEGESAKTNQFHIIEEEEFIIVRIPWSELPPHLADETTVNMADENIKIEVINDNLVLTRMLGVITRVEGEERITLITPPMGIVGAQTLTVFNKDGKRATAEFTFTSPFRPPVITNIIPTSVEKVEEIGGTTHDPAISIDVATSSPSGGSPLIIEGTNFRAGIKIFIGDNEAEIRSKSAGDDELIIIVPEASTGTVGEHLRILIVNEDGGFAYGDVVPAEQTRNPFYFKYILPGSFPEIDNVTPELGPVTGGTKITIKGSGFRNEDTFGNPEVVRVFIGGFPVPQENVTYIDYHTLEVITPEGRVGLQTIEAINFDEGRAVAADLFTYISQPNIESIAPGKLFTNDIETEVTITGTMFMVGAKVIVGGVMRPEDDVETEDAVLTTGIRGVDEDGNNRKMAIVGGMEAAFVTVENENTIIVKFHDAIDLDNSHIIVVNEDGGLSSEYKDFEYQIPIPMRPLVLEAIPGAESSVHLIWSKSDPEILNRAEKYEIYAKKSIDKTYTYIGDTTDAQFFIRELEPNTEYRFKVRAMNEYGSAIDFAEVNVRTLSEREDEQLREKLEELDDEETKLKKEGKTEIFGNIVVRTIGTEEIKSGRTDFVIDFSFSKFDDINEFTVAVPVSILMTTSRWIKVTDGDFSYRVRPRDLFTRQASEVSIHDINDAHMRITFKRLEGIEENAILSAIERTQRKASKMYELSFSLQVKRNVEDIRQLLRNGILDIDFDTMMHPRANEDNLFLAIYDPASHSFIKEREGKTTTTRTKGIYMLLSSR